MMEINIFLARPYNLGEMDVVFLFYMLLFLFQAMVKYSIVSDAMEICLILLYNCDIINTVLKPD